MKIAFIFLLNILSIFNPLLATDGEFVDINDLTKQVKFVDYDYVLEVNNHLYSINSIYSDDRGFCFLQTGKKNKRHDESSTDDDELACIMECPDCGKFQTCGLVSKNKGRCSSCRQIFPASALSWECTRCKTQNYFNPEKCGWPGCNCPRYLCDKDEKKNINTNT